MQAIHVVKDYKTLDTRSIHRISLLILRAAWSKLNANGNPSFIVVCYQVYERNSLLCLFTRHAFGLGIFIPLVLGYSSSYIINRD